MYCNKQFMNNCKCNIAVYAHVNIPHKHSALNFHNSNSWDDLKNYLITNLLNTTPIFKYIVSALVHGKYLMTYAKNCMHYCKIQPLYGFMYYKLKAISYIHCGVLNTSWNVWLYHHYSYGLLTTVHEIIEWLCIGFCRSSHAWNYYFCCGAEFYKFIHAN